METIKTIYDPSALGLQVSKRVGEELIVFCPYHPDSNPSAEYNPTKGVFYCFGCHESKTAKQLADDLGGSLVAISTLPSEFDPKIGDDQDWVGWTKNPLAYGNGYLFDRVVSDKQIQKYGIMEHQEGVIFPIADRFENVVGVQVRRYTKKPKYMFYGKRQSIWPMSNLFGSGPLFVTEGVFGVLRAEHAAYGCAVSIMGSGGVEFSTKILNNLGHREVYIVMDQDWAGLVAAGKFLIMGFKVILHNDRFEPDDWSITRWASLYAEPETAAYSGSAAVQTIIDGCDDPLKMYNLLDKFWNKGGF